LTCTGASGSIRRPLDRRTIASASPVPWRPKRSIGKIVR
jgi:hypothetical protein